MPFHVRAEPGDYAEACLLPGDPLRARYIAESHLEDAVESNAERGLLGYTGTYQGKPVSVQATGMGAPSAALVMEELVQLGVRRFLRVGTCGGLQPDLELGDLVLALSAAPVDATATHYLAGDAPCPTADWELLHATVHAAKELGERLRVGPIVTSDLFYDRDSTAVERWSSRGLLAVEMESAVLFTVAAVRRVQAATLLTVSDVIVDGDHRRIADDELRGAVDRMTRVALTTLTAEPKHH